MREPRTAGEEIETLLSWGLDYRGRGQVKEAVACWRRVLALSPGHAQASELIESVSGAASEDEPTRPSGEGSGRVGSTPAPPKPGRAPATPLPPSREPSRPPGTLSPFSAMFLTAEARRAKAGPTPVPAARAGDSRGSPTPVPASGGVGAARPRVRTVLVADGNSTTASLTRTIARVALGKDAGYVSVATGPEAIEAAAQKRPDLCVMEFMLSGKDGIETLLKIRERLGTSVPAVLTVHKIQYDFVRRRLPERTALVVRPFDRGTFEAALRSLFGE